MQVNLLDPRFLAEEQLRTGSNQFDLKANRMYVGIYDEKTGWFLPLEARLSEKNPKNSDFKTPFQSNNRHFKNPGINLRKAVYITDSDSLIPLKNKMPSEQYAFIQDNLDKIEEQFANYIKYAATLPQEDRNVVYNTAFFYPSGLERLIGQKVDRYGLEGPVTEYVPTNNNEEQQMLKSTPSPLPVAENVEEVHIGESKKDTTESKKTIQELLASKDTKALEEHLKEGMAAYLNSETYKKFLSFSALFPQYSATNRHLIFLQNQDAQFIAGFKKWKELGNPIKKGGKSLKIRAPYQYFLKNKNGDKVLDDDGQPIEKTGYRFVSVFDQTQTELPEKVPSPLKEIEGDYGKDPEAFMNVMQSLQATTIAKITMASLQQESDKTDGLFMPKFNRIIIKQGMGQKKTVAVTLHEVVHSRLHREFAGKFGDTEYSKNEFEAESVAYIVGTTLGIDMSEQSFGYMKSWQPNEKNLSALQESFVTIKEEAEKMIGEIDAKLTELQHPEQSKTRSPLAEIEAQRGQKIGAKVSQSNKSTEQKKSERRSNSNPLAR